jgi:pectate lyase
LITLMVSVIAVSSGSLAQAQLPAFPGAEGIGALATGGRGGDVYVVTTLDDYDPDNDSDNSSSGDRWHPSDAAEAPIIGSLRHGILTAPAQGRTIVFAVGGTIDLHDSLRLDGKDNITIAGQTAPGGGITLAKHDLHINNQANNIIVQHLRVRPGDRTSANHPLPQYAPGPSYNPDAVWVENSSNIILDHITASWGVDETISVTHNSDNVTVQWSTISQALYDGGHTEGDGHSYGSLLNSGTYSFHHNLYAHSKSRNPQPQDAHENHLELDFVNNVIFNPQDRYGSGSGPFDANYIGNVGINGPQNNDSTDWLLRTNNANAKVFAEGNATDTDRNDGLFDPVVLVGEEFFRPGDAHTLMPSRFSFSNVAASSAHQAYVDVLTRAGAMNYRDPVDRQLIRSVINQLNWSIDTQADVVTGTPPQVGYPTLPAGIAPLDSNFDGVPDSWALSKGFDPTSSEGANRLNQVYAPSGYTYLEEYIHSLTPRAYAQTGTVSHSISTAFGRGADAQINESGGLAATNSGNGTASQLNAHWSGNAGNTNQMIVLKFDLAEIAAGSVTGASLQLTASEAITGTHTFRVFGLEHDAAGWDWSEGTIDFDSLAGVNFDGNSRTLGINPAYTVDGDEAEVGDNPEIDVPHLLRLGEFSANNLAAGQTATLSDPNLAVFLNLAAFFQGDDQDGLITLIVEQINNSTTFDASFHSKEGNASFAPKLLVDAVLAEINPPTLEGDYNNDGTVDAADYTVWRDALGSDGLPFNETASLGIVDNDDYLAWKSNFGATNGGGSLANVPEPGGLFLIAVGTVLVSVQRKQRGPARA